MNIRLLALPAVAAALAVAVVPARATPYAGEYRYLTSGPIAVHGADGARWLLQIGATQSGSYESRAEQRLYVDLTRCADGCVEMGRWSRPLTNAEISISPFGTQVLVSTGHLTARLRTVLSGVNLDITMRQSGNSYGAVGGFGLSTTPPGLRPTVEQYAFASGALALGPLRCAIGSDESTFGEVTGADTVGDDARNPRVAPPRVLPPGLLKGKGTARC